jgi:hypothetical protein
MSVVDYSGACPGVSALRAAGAVGVVRYLSWLPNPKVITTAECATLRAAQLGVSLVWEYDARDWLSGAAAGAQHAAEAVRQARALGHPYGAGIYGAADFDMVSSSWTSSARGYAVAFRDGVRAGGYRVGVYGPYDVLTWCLLLSYDLYWQAGMSSSWSGGRNASPWPGYHLRQRRAATIGGTQCDISDIGSSGDWGAAPLPTTTSRRYPGMLLAQCGSSIVLTDWATWRDASIPYGQTQDMRSAGIPQVAVTTEQLGRILALPAPGTAPAATVGDVAAVVGSAMASLRLDLGADDLQTLAGSLAAALSAHPGSPLGAEDEPAIVDAVKTAFREMAA